MGASYLALVVYAVLRRPTEPATLLGEWSIATLLPVLNLIPRNNFVNDRYMYLPIIGFTAVLRMLL